MLAASWRFGRLRPDDELRLGHDLPELNIAPCQRPQSSSQRTVNCPSWLVVVKAMLSCERVGIGLDPELVRPEVVDDVERGDVELRRSCRPGNISCLVSKPPKVG